MKTTILACALALGTTFVLGCGGGTMDGSDAATVTPFEEQVEWGAMLFGEHCARCHGDGGEGTTLGPRLVGLDMGALPENPPPGAMVRDTAFVTVGDVATFAATNMPGDAPGSLELEEYLAILAFDLFANGIVLEDELTLEVAAGLTIPRGDR
jgi:cytochrome c